jgi:hypothetical protein
MLNISKQIYVGWDSAALKHDSLYEAEVIPLGESPQEKKKLNQFVLKNNTLYEHDNVPLPGFTLYDVNKKNWGSPDSTWVVIDPRGFLVRITQDNMAMILKVSGITEGLIQQQCIWAREDSATALSLVPISSKLYAEAVSNTELLETKVDIKDVKIGDTVLLQNKLKGTYLGVMSLYGPIHTFLMKDKVKPQVMMRKQVIEVSPGKFHYQTDAKILKVLGQTSNILTRDDAVKHVNNNIQHNPTTFFASNDRMGGNYYGSHGRVKLASTHAAPKVNIKLEEITYTDAIVLHRECKSVTDTGTLVVENSTGKKFLIDFPWHSSLLHQYLPEQFYILGIQSIGPDSIVLDTKPKYDPTKPKSVFTLDIFTKFYKIVKSVKSDTYI